MTDMQLKYLQHLEDVRKNQEAESLKEASLVETNRANLADEAERYRHNKATEFDADAERKQRGNIATWDLTHKFYNTTANALVGATKAVSDIATWFI